MHRDDAPGVGDRPRLSEFSISAAAHEELRWFFNVAEIEADVPSPFSAFFTGRRPGSLEATERRAEAVHALGKIRRRLESLGARDARMLEELYTERPWPDLVDGELGVLAGPIVAMPVVKVEYLHALARGRTQTDTVALWIEELLAEGEGDEADAWKSTARRQCATAIVAYERARGRGPSVVPEELLGEEEE